jgi:hypothetical protein
MSFSPNNNNDQDLFDVLAYDVEMIAGVETSIYDLQRKYLNKIERESSCSIDCIGQNTLNNTVECLSKGVITCQSMRSIC